PARISGAKSCGTIAVGQPANLVVCRGRNFSELLARHQSDRVVLRNGLAVSTVLPSYAELDDLMLAPRSV
ncbi:MAG: cytosine deaminase, partial [Cyanobacteria bacterium P01_E01_bin.45]